MSGTFLRNIAFTTGLAAMGAGAWLAPVPGEPLQKQRPERDCDKGKAAARKDDLKAVQQRRVLSNGTQHPLSAKANATDNEQRAHTSAEKPIPRLSILEGKKPKPAEDGNRNSHCNFHLGTPAAIPLGKVADAGEVTSLPGGGA